MSVPNFQIAVEPAQSDYIKDDTLAAVRNAWESIKGHDHTTGDIELVVLCVGPLLQELAAHRQNARQSLELHDPTQEAIDAAVNVVSLARPETRP